MRTWGNKFLLCIVLALGTRALPVYAQDDPLEPPDPEDVSSVLSDEFNFDPNSPDAIQYLRNLTHDLNGDEVLDNLRLIDPRGILVKKGFVVIRSDSVLFKAKPAQPDKLAVEIRRLHMPAPKLTAFDSMAERDGTGIRGKTILLDAGHRGTVAGSLEAWAPDEGHFVEFTKGTGGVSEGRLTLGVAQILGRKLEQAGAIVAFTRTESPMDHFPIDRDRNFDATKEIQRWFGDAALALPQWKRVVAFFNEPASILKLSTYVKDRTRRDAFKLYDKYDLFRRSRMADDLHPDATISIHFNAEKLRQRRFGKMDGVSVFLPGGIRPDALDRPEKIFSWFRRLTEYKGARRALSLGTLISKGCQSSLNLEATTRGRRRDGQWTTDGWLLMDATNAVFERAKILVLRRVPGPIVLVEGPYMNNEDEYLKLSTNDLLVEAWGTFGKHVYPTRVAEYAQGLFDGISAYFGN